MKTIKTIILVALIFSLGTSFASGKTISVFDGFVTPIEFLNVKKGHQLIIKDSNDNVVYTENIQNSGTYTKGFDFAELQNGTYSVELVKDFEIIIKPFVIKEGRVMFLTDLETKLFKPHARLKNNKLMVSQLVLNNEPLKIELYYNDTIIYKEDINGDKNLNRIYRLSETEKGYYNIVMVSGGRVFSETYKM
ncbi:MAG: hypothetical protein WA775_03130 [Psychroserpens sp.]|uniref:hypothetical protein n=1 Tax=Psychroserpens sp. TaxID=2020870 RepID=UPI003C71FF85